MWRARRPSVAALCLDFGHAHLDGDLVDAIETVSEHSHRACTCTTTAGGPTIISVPFEGTIDWPAALTAIQKVGYDGPLMFEIGRAGIGQRDARRGLKRRVSRMERFCWQTKRKKCNHESTNATKKTKQSRFVETIMHVYIEDIGAHVGEEITIKGWLHNRRSSGKIHFLIRARRHRFRRRRVMSKAAVGEDMFKAADHLSQETSVIVTGTARAPTSARAERLRDRRQARSRSSASRTTTRSRRRSTASTTCSTAGTCGSARERQQAILRIRHEIINAVRDFFNARGFILADTPIFTPAACEGTTTLFPAQYFEDTDGVPDAKRTAVQRGQRHGARPRLLLRADVSRREIEDAPPPDRVLDGRARRWPTPTSTT